METDKLHAGDSVEVRVYTKDGERIAKVHCNDFHDATQAVQKAYRAMEEPKHDIRDYVFEVVDSTNATAGRYRVDPVGKVYPEK